MELLLSLGGAGLQPEVALDVAMRLALARIGGGAAAPARQALSAAQDWLDAQLLKGPAR